MTASIADTDESDDFDVRADHVDEATLRSGTVTVDWYERIHAELLKRSLTLLVGPRGCGKTHMMRFSWLKCVEDDAKPLALYASFNRYLRLEPLLRSRSDAGSLFHIWVLCRILISLAETIDRMTGKSFDIEPYGGVSKASATDFVTTFERGLAPSKEEEEAARRLSVDSVVDAIRAGCAVAGRRRTILLLDDAALTLAPEYMAEFLDVVRAIKRTDVSPKCSVYPGTDYGPRFHSVHEAIEIQAWLPVDRPRYHEILREIALARFPAGAKAVDEDVDAVLRHAAFGVPRAYLSLLKEMTDAQGGQTWSNLNRVLRANVEGKRAEYGSLAKKIPRYATVIGTGGTFFEAAVASVREANEKLRNADEKQILLSVEKRDFDVMSDRMTGFLIEAGLIYEQDEVLHGGPDRRYRRFVIHVGVLIVEQAFSTGDRKVTVAGLRARLERKATKHAVRRKLGTLIPDFASKSLGLDLPPCQQCGEPRVADVQKHCMNCGARLSDPSIFTQLTSFPIADVTRLSRFKKEILENRKIKTIGEFLAYKDIGSELRKEHGVGKIRAQQIIDVIESIAANVDEFIS